MKPSLKQQRDPIFLFMDKVEHIKEVPGGHRHENIGAWKRRAKAKL